MHSRNFSNWTIESDAINTIYTVKDLSIQIIDANILEDINMVLIIISLQMIIV